MLAKPSAALVVVLACVAFAGSAPAASRRTQVQLGSAKVPAGKTVLLPVTVRDRQETPLGWERPFGERIQGIALKVRAVPATGVASITVRRAGVTAGLAPLFEAQPRAAGAGSLVVSFDEATQLVPLSPAGRTGQIVATVEVKLAPGLARGTVIELRLDPGVTVLSNQGGTVAESVANGWLEITDGRIEVAE